MPRQPREPGSRQEEHISYYARNRDRILKATKEYQKNHKEKSQQYQKEYYQRVKEKKKEQRLKRLHEDLQNQHEIEALVANDDDTIQHKDWKEEPDLKWSDEEEPKVKGNRTPRQYYTSIEPEEFNLTSYTKSRLRVIAPQGFYQRPEGENPFHLTWD